MDVLSVGDPPSFCISGSSQPCWADHKGGGGRGRPGSGAEGTAGRPWGDLSHVDFTLLFASLRTLTTLKPRQTEEHIGASSHP